MSRAEEHKEKTLTAWQIGMMLDKYGDPVEMIPVIASAIDIWCSTHGEDMEAITAMLMETVATTNGISYEDGE